MIIYTKRYVNIVSLLITILIYIFFSKSKLILNKIDLDTHLISSVLKRSSVLVELNSNNINQETKDNSETQNNYTITQTKENLETTEEKNWQIIIPKISLEANISEGTRKETMDKYVGHFEETSKKDGNIGLAAHNRGY